MTQVRGLRSISGHCLEGKSLVRILYLDEAGISNPKHEPYLVVAGVLVHGDSDWPKVHDYLESLAKRYGLSSIFDFHAKNIFHGTGIFDRDDPQWPIGRRRELLLELASIPNKLRLPVAVGFIRRDNYKRMFDEQMREIQRVVRNFKASADAWAHGEAFVNAVRAADYWLESHSRVCTHIGH